MQQVSLLLIDLVFSTKFDRLLTNLHKLFLLSANLLPPSNLNRLDIYHGVQASSSIVGTMLSRVKIMSERNVIVH
jgi:hypothetical protein